MINLYNSFYPTAKKLLNNLSKWLQEAKKLESSRNFSEDVIPNARLYPDMLNLTFQIRIACDTVKLSLCRISGVENPVFEDNEKNLDELLIRIEKTLKFMESIAPSSIEGKESHKIHYKTRTTEYNWDAEFYVTHHVIPNFYFHITTAYAILRSMGIELGKKTYLPY